MQIIFAVCFLFAILMVAVLLAVRRLRKMTDDLPLSAEWIDELSTEKYRPLMRLLDRRDLDLLRSQPNFTWRVAARFRKQRCQIFRGYLAWMKADFDQVCTAIRVLMLHSKDDRPDLAATLIRSRIQFAAATAGLNVRLFLYQLGWSNGDAARLVKIFDSMRLELRTLVPTAVGAAA